MATTLPKELSNRLLKTELPHYQSVLDRIKPMMEEELERREYTIFKAKMKESH